MSWTDVGVFMPRASKGAAAEVTLALSAGAGRRRAQMTLTIRTLRLPGIGAWIADGATVRVMIGAGEHANMLRVQPRGPHAVAKSGGRLSEGVMHVRLPPLAGAVGKHAAQAVDYEYNEDWLEITLPDWARPAPVNAGWQGAAPAAEAKAPKQAFSMIAGSVPATQPPRKGAMA